MKSLTNFLILLQKYKKCLEQSTRGSEFIFDSVDFLHYKFHKISLNRGRSCIDSSKWLKNKGAPINPKKNDNKCFQCAVTVALNRENNVKDPQRTFKLFVDQYNWK